MKKEEEEKLVKEERKLSERTQAVLSQKSCISDYNPLCYGQNDYDVLCLGC